MCSESISAEYTCEYSLEADYIIYDLEMGPGAMLEVIQTSSVSV